MLRSAKLITDLLAKMAAEAWCEDKREFGNFLWALSERLDAAIAENAPRQPDEPTQ